MAKTKPFDLLTILEVRSPQWAPGGCSQGVSSAAFPLKGPGDDPSLIFSILWSGPHFSPAHHPPHPAPISRWPFSLTFFLLSFEDSLGSLCVCMLSGSVVSDFW